MESNTKDVLSHIPHTNMHTFTYISCTLAFVTRFTAEVLPHRLKELIEEGFQEWEESLYEVTIEAVCQLTS